MTLSPGGPNVLIRKVLEEFCPRFTPGAKVLYVGDIADWSGYRDEPGLKALGLSLVPPENLPDVVAHHEAKARLLLIEAVNRHGPMSPARHQELKALFKGSKAAPVFVTAFLKRRDLGKHLNTIAWETHVWVAESGAHMIHFDGERLFGPSEVHALGTPGSRRRERRTPTRA